MTMMISKGSQASGESPWDTFLVKQFEERNLTIRTAWDIYIKFYVAFLTLNVAGIGVVVQYVQLPSRGPIVYAFAMHNLLAIGTAFFIWRLTKQLNTEVEEIAEQLRDREGVNLNRRQLVALRAPTPRNLVLYSAIGNAITHVGLIACWIWLLWSAAPLPKS
jgi:uncharacterized membrane protein YqjE